MLGEERQTADTRYVNMVFQGGGIRGIAYCGVLDTMPQSIHITGVGGTSAGALMAALLATGKRGPALKKILSDPRLFSLLRTEDVQRRRRIVETIKTQHSEIKKLLSEWMADGKPLSGFTLWGCLSDRSQRKRVTELCDFWRSAHKDIEKLIADVAHVWNAKGFHSSAPLRDWLHGILNRITFGDLAQNKAPNTIHDLRIVAADVTTQEYVVYTAEKHPSTEIADAVLASASIPLFFEPFVHSNGGRHLVDGGILSNFPAFLFAQSPNPTIGFRLVDVPPLTQLATEESAEYRRISSTWEFLLLTLKTMAEAHDKFRPLPSDFHLHRVAVPDDIPYDKFDLTATDVDRLFDKAKAETNVNWERCSAPSTKPRTFDPNPQSALTFCIEQGKQLADRYYSKERWAQFLQQEVELEVTIDGNWNSTYIRTMSLRVMGDRPIYLMNVTASGLPKGSNSLSDHVPVYQEILGDGSRKDVVLLPTSNQAERKGFVAVFDPPIVQGEQDRKFWLRWCIKEEFSEVPCGQAGEISFHSRQLAQTHKLGISMRVLADRALGPLKVETASGQQFLETDHSWVPGAISNHRIYEFGKCRLDVAGLNGLEAYIRTA